MTDLVGFRVDWTGGTVLEMEAGGVFFYLSECHYHGTIIDQYSAAGSVDIKWDFGFTCYYKTDNVNLRIHRAE